MNSGQRPGAWAGMTMTGIGLICGSGAVHAQSTATSATSVEEITVTGSRIRRPEATTAAPTTVIDSQALTERGFVQLGQALNEATAITPSAPIRPSDGSSTTAGGGEQLPALFGLGAGRTLTLVNGRRFISTASGFGVPGVLEGGTNDSVVDTNVIPVGLLQRVEIVQGAGAAVYGSDAMGGVVNYILREDFEGLEVDAQYGRSSYDDYPVSNARVTWGTNFAEHGNVAVNVEWSKTEPLLTGDRPLSKLGRVTSANPLDTGPNDGIPQVTPVLDARFWEFNTTGVLFAPPNPAAFPTRAFITTDGVRFNQFAGVGIPAQLNAAGTALVPYAPGSFPSAGPSIPFASGGDGYRFRDLGSLYAGVERKNVNLIGHYDLTPDLKLSTELLYSRVDGEDPLAGLASNTILNSADTGSGAIAVSGLNPFITPAVRQSIVSFLNANPALFGPNSGFGWSAGAPLPVTLSKVFPDLLPDTTGTRKLDTIRAVVALDGNLEMADHKYYWTVSGTYGNVDGKTRTWGVWQAHFDNAINARTGPNGTPVCAINVDATPGNDDATCAPINPFGVGNISDAARRYATTLFGQDYENEQFDYLATLGGSLFRIPGGDVSFSVAYEYRSEDATFTPNEASRLGVGRAAIPQGVQQGQYHTNEYSAEVLVPIFGGDFKVPAIESLNLTGAFRSVDNSVAGSETVWSAGLQWQPIDDVMLRVSRSRNFRAPNLAQLFSPASTGLEGILADPCDADRIGSGPNPAVRRANCQALFAANPGYGPLATFQDASENFPIALVTRGGNRDLENELSDTLSYGFVLEPAFAPGLTIIADRIEVDLEDGLSFFSPADFLATCFDSAVQPTDICAVTTRDAAGQVIASSAVTFNAGSIEFRGETYDVSYQFPLGALFGGRDFGQMFVRVEATHVTSLETSVTGVDLSQIEGTTAQPDWRVRFDARYSRGPVHATYSASYLPSALAAEGATIENSAQPVIGSNLRHSISGQYDITDWLSVRAGVENFTNERPSYPTIFYGDILGRQYYVGARAKF
jgi:iron complex outermembrane receptor protein